MIVNMIVDLTSETFVTQGEDALLAAAGLTLVNRLGAAQRDLDWIHESFGGKWPDEAAAGRNWIAQAADGRPAGFATYAQSSFKWWWLEPWIDCPDVGVFGPMGIDIGYRNRRIGTVVARRALASLKLLGYERAIIGAVGPIEFYEKHCGARVIERLEPPLERGAQ